MILLLDIDTGDFAKGKTLEAAIDDWRSIYSGDNPDITKLMIFDGKVKKAKIMLIDDTSK